MKNFKNYSFYAWFFLCFNILVILGGAYVRASHSGEGCGKHWPLCHGVLFPDFKIFQTLVEYSHRISSGFVFLGTLLLFIWAVRLTERGHPIRLISGIAFLFVIFEALLGAGLVLWGFVGKNASFGRILLMPLHLLSTFALLASLALAAAWSSGFRIFQIKALLKMPVRLFFLIFGLLLVGMSGALTALSDTLFKPDFVGENLFIDFVQADHFLKALRAYHPLVAIFVTLFALHVIWKFTHVHSSSRRKKLAFFITIFFIVQMICGFFNIVLLVPVEMQILHLFFANIIWVFCILFCSEVLSEEQPFEKSLRCG